MAPELFDRQQPSPASDLYSLGILLYHLVTGAYPLDGSTASEMHDKHLGGQRRRLRDARPDLPTEFVRIVERAIDPNVATRYGSAGDLEVDLAQFVVRDERAAEPARVSVGAPPRRGETWKAVLGWSAVVLIAAALALFAGLRFTRWRAVPATPASPMIRSLVVLPLRNTSGNAEQDYFVDGMTELLTADLSGISALRVISDSSASHYRNTTKSGAEIGRELHVDGVVEGSVSRSGDRVRVTLQIVYAGTNLSVWGSSFEREAGDAFRLQADIAQAIVTRVKSAITSGEQERLTQVYVARPDVQDLYLRGRYLMHTFNRDRLKEARLLLERAVQRDPRYALAWTSLARCYLLLHDWGVLTSSESRRLGLNAARTALELDQSMFEAQSQMAEVLFRADWNWVEADAHYRLALDANPSFAMGRWQYARFLSAAGRVEAAVAEARRAEQSDPLSTDAKGTVSTMLFYQRDFAAALAKADETIALDRNQSSAFVARGRALVDLGRLDEALRAEQEALRLSGGRPAIVAEIGRIYALMGRRKEAETMLARVSPGGRAGDAVAYEDIAFVQLALGRRDEALAALNQAIDQRSDRVLWLRVDPRVDALRRDSKSSIASWSASADYLDPGAHRK